MRLMMKRTTHIIHAVGLLACFILMGQNEANAQLGCTGELACNFDPDAIIDDGSCIYQGYFIPVEVEGGPAVLACEAPEGYYFPDQDCVETVISADPFCLETLWDQTCENAYNSCLGCSDPQFYIPFVFNSGPAIEACTTPPGYYLADQVCILDLRGTCTLNLWDAFCQNPYDECTIGCTIATWSIPVEPGGGPAVYSCSEPDGYYVPNEDCLLQVIADDPYCTETNWDTVCEDAFNACLGCSDPQFYLPYWVDGTSPAIEACSPPEGYYLANKDCVMEAISTDHACEWLAWQLYGCQSPYDLCYYGCELGDWFLPIEVGSGPAIYGCSPPPGYYRPFHQVYLMITLDAMSDCAELVWGPDCQAAFNDNALGCNDASWYIPYVLNSGPPVYDCEAPEGYYLPDQDCVIEVMLADPFCLELVWDHECQDAYDLCLYGCDANWYIPAVPGSLPAYYGCEPVLGYFLPDQQCASEVIAADPFCITTFWDTLCQDAYEDCIYGCTYFEACNYSESAIYGDGTCLFPGCTDPLAANYDPEAGCSDDSCLYISCTGDLDGDGLVSTSDLLMFLVAFGNACP
jgi:hypothetical protein